MAWAYITELQIEFYKKICRGVGIKLNALASDPPRRGTGYVWRASIIQTHIAAR